MSDDWYVRKGQKTLGPWSDEQLRKAVATGRISPKAAVRRGLIGPWTAAARVLDSRTREKSPPSIKKEPRLPIAIAAVAGLAALAAALWVGYEIRRKYAPPVGVDEAQHVKEPAPIGDFPKPPIQKSVTDDAVVPAVPRVRQPLRAQRPVDPGPTIAGPPRPFTNPRPSSAPPTPPAPPKAAVPMQNAVPVAVQKAPAKNSEFPDLETAAVHALAAKDALALYDHYSATHTMTPSQEQSFNERHKTWEGRARQGLVRLGNKWVVSAEAERAHEEAARLYRQAQGMTKTLYFAEARLALKQASRVDPDSIAADFSLGILDSIAPVELRSPKDAMTHFRSVLQRTPGYVPALNNLAIAEIRQDKYADALRHFGQAADRSPATEEIKRNLGRFISEAKLGRIRPRQTALSDAARLYAKLAFSKEVSRSEGVGWQFIPFVSPNGERETLPSLNYEDHVCSACNGRGRMTCRAPGCQHGQIHGDALVNNPINIGSARSPLVVDNINSVPVSHACPTCGGTGYVRCPYCGGATSRNLDTPTPSRKTRRKK